jgi:trans-aconitate methyltransferase
MATRVHTENYRPLKVDWRLKSDPQPTADWNAYAATYDLLLEYNPAYQQLLQDFESILSDMDAPRVIYDVGGGTGNYSQIAAGRYPESSIYFIEPDQGMTQRAKEKLSGHDNVVYIDRPLQEVEAPAKADFVICAHSLYSMPDPQERLIDLKKLLRPGGLLFLLDLGRPMNVADWRFYLFSHLVKELGVAKAIQVLWKGREIAKQNKAIFKAQQVGLYWTHSASEICSAVEKAGFEVLTQKKVYRGYSDLLLCRATS